MRSTPAGLEFSWPGGGVFEVQSAHCVSASLHPSDDREGQRLVFEFAFLGGAPTESALALRAEVPPGRLEDAQRFVDALWTEHSIPDHPASGTKRHGGPAPAAVAVPVATATPAPAPAPASASGSASASRSASDSGSDSGSGSTEAVLERVTSGRDWIVNPVGRRSEELFRDVMARPDIGDN
ncbi:hypothetical protein ACF07V_24815 [Streptomyces sp. NPDC015661]|uniref:hypothetical protein n=1 Tax=Streptomyces sp. NPDC015661 TaxID=3364961 RepID=UPI0037002587